MTRIMTTAYIRKYHDIYGFGKKVEKNVKKLENGTLK